jgi:hypothetical protein
VSSALITLVLVLRLVAAVGPVAPDNPLRGEGGACGALVALCLAVASDEARILVSAGAGEPADTDHLFKRKLVHFSLAVSTLGGLTSSPPPAVTIAFFASELRVRGPPSRLLLLLLRVGGTKVEVSLLLLLSLG